MNSQENDLVISAGRLFCADTGLDGPGAVAVRDGLIAKSGPRTADLAGEALSFPDGILLPGFVDLHAHPAPSDWRFGIDPDSEILPRGTTTMLSQGDAGAATWDAYRGAIIERSRARIRMALSPAVYGERYDRGCFDNLDEIDVDACVETIESDGGEHIWGIAANLASTGRNDPREVMRRTMEAAERSGKPLLYGVRRQPGDWPIDEQLALLRAGDVFTYCLQGDAETIVAGGRVRDSVWEARERGVLFDVGLGKGTTNMGVSVEALADGFLPDTISTDVYKRHLGWDPPHDMPMTISKLIRAGMPETEAFARATLHPARVLGLAGEVGTLAVGAHADLVVLRWNAGPVPQVDTADGVLEGPYLEPLLTVRAGVVVE